MVAFETGVGIDFWKGATGVMDILCTFIVVVVTWVIPSIKLCPKISALQWI